MFRTLALCAIIFVAACGSSNEFDVAPPIDGLAAPAPSFGASVREDASTLSDTGSDSNADDVDVPWKDSDPVESDVFAKDSEASVDGASVDSGAIDTSVHEVGSNVPDAASDALPETLVDTGDPCAHAISGIAFEDCATPAGLYSLELADRAGTTALGNGVRSYSASCEPSTACESTVSAQGSGQLFDCAVVCYAGPLAGKYRVTRGQAQCVCPTSADGVYR